MSLANHVPVSPDLPGEGAARVGSKLAVVDGDGTEVSYAEPGRDCDAMDAMPATGAAEL